MTTASFRRLAVLLVVAVALMCAGHAAIAAAPPSQFPVEIADTGRARELADVLKEKGYRTEIPAKNMWVLDPQTNSVIWIGKNVPLDMLRVVIPEALRFNPYIRFYHVVGDRGEVPPERVDNSVHVGGHIDAALVKKLNQIEPKEMLDALAGAKTLEQFHRFLHDRNIPKAEAVME